MIRVLHTVGGMNRGGIETFIMNLYRSIDREKIQFDFLLNTDKECAYNDEIRKLGGRIFSVPRLRSWLKRRKAIKTFLENHPEYKVIHFHTGLLITIDVLKIAKRYGIGIRIIHSHSTRHRSAFICAIHKWNQLLIKNYATRYFACSEPAAEWMFGDRQYEKKEYVIIKNGIDTRNFLFSQEQRIAARRELGIEDELVFGHIGSFAHVKNHEFLIDIFSEITRLNKNTKLILVGDGQLREDIEKKISLLKLSDKVILTGVRTDISSLLCAMDVFVMPSRNEGLGIVLIEAQASGLPCMASDVIPGETKVSENFQFISLNKPAKEWAEAALVAAGVEKRSTGVSVVSRAGYDIKDVAAYMEKVYLER